MPLEKQILPLRIIVDDPIPDLAVAVQHGKSGKAALVPPTKWQAAVAGPDRAGSTGHKVHLSVRRPVCRPERISLGWPGQGSAHRYRGEPDRDPSFRGQTCCEDSRPIVEGRASPGDRSIAAPRVDCHSSMSRGDRLHPRLIGSRPLGRLKTRLCRTIALVSVLVCLFPERGEARPTIARFLGTWTIAREEVAPWATDHQAIHSAEAARLLHTIVTFMPNRIVGPEPLSCPRLRYHLRASAPDRLFQGSLPRPNVQARALGFQGTTIATLETGCAGGIDFHFRDSDTALFGLNDVIYTLQK